MLQRVICFRIDQRFQFFTEWLTLDSRKLNWSLIVRCLWNRFDLWLPEHLMLPSIVFQRSLTASHSVLEKLWAILPISKSDTISDVFVEQFVWFSMAYPDEYRQNNSAEWNFITRQMKPSTGNSRVLNRVTKFEIFDDNSVKPNCEHNSSRSLKIRSCVCEIHWIAFQCRDKISKYLERNSRLHPIRRTVEKSIVWQ
jgi:hypothetical protein